MPLRATVLGGLLLLAALCPPIASAQVSGPDDLCPANADPCLVTSAHTLPGTIMLDFGNRELRITPTGRLNGPGSSVGIVARELHLEAGGQINLQVTGTEEPGGTLDLSITDLADIVGSINLSGDAGGSLFVVAQRFDLGSNGALRLNGITTDSSGGTVDITADEVNLNGLIQLNGGSAATGGTVGVAAATVLSISGIVEVKGGEGDGGSMDIDCGGNITVTASAALRLDGSGAGGGGDLSMTAGDTFLGTGVGSLTMQGTISSSGSGDSEGGGDGGTIELAAGEDCMVTGKITANSGSPDGSGGSIQISCGEQSAGDVIMSAELDAHGNGSEAAGGSIELRTDDGGIQISNKITATGTGGGGVVTAVATRAITLSDRINVSSGGAKAGRVSLSANGTEQAEVILTPSGSINADGSGTPGGTVILEGCTTRVQLRSGSAQSVTANGTMGMITLIGVNRIQIAGRLSGGEDIALIYRDFEPFLEATAVLSPGARQVIDESLADCGTAVATRTPTRTRTVPTPTLTPTRSSPTSTPTRTLTPTPTGPTRTPTPRPTPAGPTDANCNGVIDPDETAGVIEAIYDASFTAVCSNADANGDGRASAADLPALIQKIAMP